MILVIFVKIAKIRFFMLPTIEKPVFQAADTIKFS